MLSKYQTAVAVASLTLFAGGVFLYSMNSISTGQDDANVKIITERIRTPESVAPPPESEQIANDLPAEHEPVEFASGDAPPDTESDVESSLAPDGSDPVELKININNADREELETLPGIGPVLAERIITYRKESGPFISPEELVNVKGIGEKKLEKILPFIIAE